MKKLLCVSVIIATMAILTACHGKNNAMPSDSIITETDSSVQSTATVAEKSATAMIDKPNLPFGIQ